MFKIVYRFTFTKHINKTIKLTPLLYLYILNNLSKNISFVVKKSHNNKIMVIKSPFHYKTSKQNIFNQKQEVIIRLISPLNLQTKKHLLYFINNSFYTFTWLKLNRISVIE